MLAAMAGGATAAPLWLQEFTADLYAGRTVQAGIAAEIRLTQEPEDMQARFALGTSRFLLAIEHLGQGLYRYGSRYQPRSGYGLGLPILRLPIPENPNPEPVTYDGLRAILSTFVDDLQVADAALGAVTSDDVNLRLDLARLRLDFDGSGSGEPDETLSTEIARIIGVRTMPEAGSLEFDFDGSDVLWLRAYSHLLMALGDFALGYDWHDAFEATFQSVFPKGPFPIVDELTAETAIWERMNQLRPLMTEEPPMYRFTGSVQWGTPEWRAAFAKWQAAHSAWEATDGGRSTIEYRTLESRLQFGAIADLAAFVHLTSWPVDDPGRLAAVMDNLQAMVSLSRGSWRRILAETDSAHEWIPSPKQSGGLPGMRVTEDRVEAWLSALDQIDEVLAGKLLIPHWRFDKGINLRKFFLQPRPFDLVVLLQGTGAIPYLEPGPRMDSGRWWALASMFEGDLLRYFLYFN
jgi:hypothetical protein